MNRQRRKQISEVMEELVKLHATVNELGEQESEAFDNLPASIQEAEKGKTMWDISDHLTIACDAIQEAMDNLESAVTL